MGVEIELDWAPVPDGQTVPHKPEVAENARAWNAGWRWAWLLDHFGQIAYVGCMVLVPALIIIGTAKS